MAKVLFTKEEILVRRGNILKVRYIAITAGLIATLFLRIFLEVPFPNLFFVLLFSMLISTAVYHYFNSRATKLSVTQIVNIHFGYMLFDLLPFTAIIYLLGGITWFGFIFYTLYIYLGFIFFPKSYITFYVLYSIFLFTAAMIIQYLKLLPTYELFSLEQRVPQNLNYVLTFWLGVVVFLFLVGKFSQFFYDALANKIIVLEKIKKILEEEKTSLEIRVRARTRQLKEERDLLEQKIKERTEELRKEKQELTQKINELQRFYKIAVGRELRIRELKKQLKQLKQKENAASS